MIKPRTFDEYRADNNMNKNEFCEKFKLGRTNYDRQAKKNYTFIVDIEGCDYRVKVEG